MGIRSDDGYAAIREYAVIGDGRTIALVARDGAIDWLPLPMLDSPSVFAAVLDAKRGGAFTMRPSGTFDATRRYLPGTNVLETIFDTSSGTARVVDALTLPAAGLTPHRELARRIEGLSGRVPMEWAVTPRFGYAQWTTRFEWRGDRPIATSGADAVAVSSWDAGRPAIDGDAIAGRFEIAQGESALVALSAAHQQPLVLPRRDDVERRLHATAEFWRRWADSCRYDGPWRDSVLRSALALKLLVHAPSGAVAAAPTTSLPEAIGGERNWDYRYCWIRDSAFTLDALLQLGFHDEAHAFFWWFMHTTALTQPRVQVLYRLDGSRHVPEHDVPLAGYRGSRPVRTGNAAASQHQLDVYGDLFHTAWLYVDRGFSIDVDTGRELAEIADLVCDIWHQPDRGIWEVRMEGKHFTQSKAMCWVALDRALQLARGGYLPSNRVQKWTSEAHAIREFVETRCWSEREQSYTRYAGTDELDASLLLMPIMDYRPATPDRLRRTADAVRRVLGHGPLLARYNGPDGLSGSEGTFLCCSFWLVHALALTGEREEAATVMDQMVALANDVGLFAEEMDGSTHAFLGNFPQGLVHLALVNAALALAEGPKPRAERRPSSERRR
ncbi:MAG: glycoside hydrolase family 15 protein [Bacteroidales bacterium]